MQVWTKAGLVQYHLVLGQLTHSWPHKCSAFPPTHHSGKVEDFDRVISVVNHYSIKDWRLFWMSVYITSGVVLGFLLHPLHHLDPAWIALFGATLLCVMSEPHDVHELLHVGRG